MIEQSFEEHRPYLRRLAYRLLGSVADADDAVQETFVRLRTSTDADIRTPRAWLTRTCTRLCLDQLKSAHRARVTYVGEWLPEPLADVEGRAEIDDTLSMALLVSIRKLKPTERAVFLLHDVFDYPFEEVATILELEPATCRQIAVRARRFLGEPRTRATPSPDEVTRLSDAFFAALDSGDVSALQSVLAADVVFRADGGGKASAVGVPLHGADAIAFLTKVFIAPSTRPAYTRARVWFNGAPGVLMRLGTEVVSAFHFEIVNGRIQGIYVQRNPDKLAAFADA